MENISDEELQGWETASNGLSWEHDAIKRLVKEVKQARARSYKPVITKVEKTDKPKADVKKPGLDLPSKDTGS